MKRRELLLSMTALAVTPAMGALAAPYFGKGAVAGGYDVVAYFTQGAPVRGDANISTQWDGATWHFSSTANRDAFVANPSAYAPQFGGYCAFAVARGYSAKGDPQAWTVKDGKLYLNFNKRIRSRWLRNVNEEIAKGHANWPTVRAGL